MFQKVIRVDWTDEKEILIQSNHIVLIKTDTSHADCVVIVFVSGTEVLVKGKLEDFCYDGKYGIR